ncbi:MAG TPA: biotin--[acetyl-CoA-carboxylase] ligase [Gemmatimonadaceae bacterium]|nr:biotin--[acetyl-CoA-carboxylase] ligase [Gemmatimonadaceae bacterium]
MVEIARYENHDSSTLARLLDVPRVVVFDSTASTMDDAHELAAVDAPAGTVVLADRQAAGRGRNGRRWASSSGEGIWMTIIERPNDARVIDVLSIRVGIRAARALDRYAASAVGLKWPNDLYVGGGKLAGILIEARWRASRVDWVAIGIGVNVREPEGVASAASLRADASRVAVLGELVPAIRSAATARDVLTPAEIDEFNARDVARGRACVDPTPGAVVGINSAGELLVQTGSGVRAFRDGSLTFAGAAG